MPNTARKTKRAEMSRWARFRAALKLADITAKDWCNEHDLTEGHLYQVLRGDRYTESTIRHVDAFIAKQFDRETWVA